MSTQPHAIVSRQEWIAARKILLAKEKTFSKDHDQLSAEQRALPWVRVEKDYVFDGPLGKVTLTQLFGHRSQLFIKHFMMTPGATQQCVGCSLAVDHIDQILPHLENHDVSYVVVARAPIEEIEAVRTRMDWHVPWVSSFGSDFNYDFDVSFTPEQIALGTASYNFRPAKLSMEDLSGHSVFFKDDSGQIFHTYSTYGRGDEQFLGIYAFFDVTPKGRDERGPHHGMADWISIRNTYGQGGTVGANGRYHAPGCSCAVHK
jgi:predicted dithiol-disulfide oxidoreductase (DUF899 family)